MHVAFVGLGSEQLAISILSAVLRLHGHTTSLAFLPALFDDRNFLDIKLLAKMFDRVDRVVDEVIASRPDLVAFSVLTPTYQAYLRVARSVKAELEVPVIFGGVHPSAVPHICLENEAVDYVCVGEGEQAIVELCRQLPPSATARPPHPIANLQWIDDGRLVAGPTAPFIHDLDALPFWDKELWEPHVRLADNWYTMSARGCPYRCTFCFNNFFAKLPGRGGGAYLRKRSVDHQLRELVEAKARFGIRRVDFQDDIFTTDKVWLEEFLDRYRTEIDLPFQCLVHPRYVDHDMARWLKAAGCEHVQMGVQSADEGYKRTELLRLEKDDHMRRSLDALGAAGLGVKVDHMLGLPGEPPGAQELARDLYASYPTRRIQTFWLTHLPGVEITRRAVETGHLSEEEYGRINRGESGRFHSRSEDLAHDADVLRRYELLFRVLPLVPRRWATRLRVHHLPPLPRWANQLAGLTLEAVNATVHRDAEAGNYVRNNLHQLRRQVPELVGDRLRRRPRRQVPPPALRAFRTPDVAAEPASEPGWVERAITLTAQRAHPSGHQTPVTLDRRPRPSRPPQRPF